MSSIFEKIRTYGVRGIRDHFAGKLETRRRRRAFLENARRHPMAPVPGVTVVAALNGQNSISKMARDFCFHLKDAGIPFQTFDLSPERQVAAQDVEPILTPSADFRALKYDHVVDMFHSPFPDFPGVKRAHVVFWEFESGLLEFDPRLDDGAQILAMSDFNLEVFRKMFRTAPGDASRVAKILYPLRFEADGLPPAKDVRARFGIGADDFVVFYNFDLGSSCGRKNPEGALRAFAAAFAGDPRAKFAMKVMGAKKHSAAFARLMQLAEELGARGQVVAVTDYLPQRELYALTNACDVYLSLHRGEGFGLGVAEAMSLGKAVIVTDHSGTSEFCRPDTALLVPYEIVPVPPAGSTTPITAL